MAPCIIISPFGVAQDSLPGGTHFIVDGVKIAPLTDHFKAKIVDYLDIKRDEPLSRAVRQRPAFFIEAERVPLLRSSTELNGKAELSILVHQFALNYFSNESIPICCFVYENDCVSHHIVDRSDLHNSNLHNQVLNEGAWLKHVTYLEFAYGRLSAAPAAEVMIGRICRAFRNGPSPDGIIDLAIALECLIETNVEIKFQFSLFHALINLSDEDERMDLFALLQDLYDIRSASVHGTKLANSHKKKLLKVKASWGQLIELSKSNLTYYIAFCHEKSSGEWQQHLRGLALGCPRFRSEQA